MDVFRQIFDWLGSALNSVLGWVLFVLPDSPFKLLSNSPISEYINYINYFVPIDYILSTLGLWIVAVGSYYGYKLILAWIKAIN